MMKKQIVHKLFSIVFGLIISLFLAELVARVYFFGSAAFSYSSTNSFGILDNSNLIKYADSKDLVYELLPNLETKYKLKSFHTNNDGFRDRHHELLTNDSIRIAVLGDSFTMGTGVSEDYLYVQKTEELLSNSELKKPCELFNFGVSGYALNDYLTILSKNALKYKPDLVVIGFCASNDQLVLGTDFSLDKFTIKSKKNVFWESYLWKLIKIKTKKNNVKPIVYESHQLQYMSENFKKFEQILTKNNAKGLIFYLDLLYDETRVDQIKKLAKQNNLLFLEVSQYFKDKKLNQYILNELDPHPNDKANLIFAQYLKDFIIKNESRIFSN
jgi:hypothetical protein